MALAGWFYLIVAVVAGVAIGVGVIFPARGQGSVSNMLFLFSYQHAEFIAIDEQPDHDIMQQDRFRKTDRLSH
jgi:hypothetical protein